MSPTFKDGLSALSYNQPHAGHAQNGPAELHDSHHDDEPMPIPSTWRQPVATEGDRWFRQQMGAAALGLVAGLMIVVPTVLWLSGLIGSGSQKQKVASAASTICHRLFQALRGQDGQGAGAARGPLQGETASQFVTGSVEAKLPVIEAPRKPEPVATIATARVPEPAAAIRAPEISQPSRSEEVLAQAARRIESGDIAGARELLAGAEVQALGQASFALAETYDPNMLAAWGTRGAVADVAKARALYAKALNQGVGKAMMRLEGLKQ